MPLCGNQRLPNTFLCFEKAVLANDPEKTHLLTAK